MTATRRPRIVLAVTTPISLNLMKGFPEHLAGAGWDVHVVASGRNPSTNEAGVSFHDIPMVRDPAPVRDLRALICWLRLLVRLHPDIVVAGTPKAGLLGMVSAWAARVPARIYLLRGLRLETEKGMARKFLHTLEWLTARCATRVQSVSHSLRERFVSLGLAPADKVVVLGAGSSNGVEVAASGVLRHATRAELGLPEGVPLVGYVGRMAPDKGVDVLLRAVRQVAVEGMCVQVVLVGPEEAPGLLGDALQTTGISPEIVRWVGVVPDARSYMGLMDVLCLPSRREGFPNVVLEAAIQGIPAVVSDATGCRDSIVDGVTGVMFPVDDAERLAFALRDLLNDPTRLKIMGKRAREHAIQNFDRLAVWRLSETFFTSQIDAAERRPQ